MDSLNFIFDYHKKNCKEINILNKLIKIKSSQKIENFFYLPVSFLNF